MNFCASSDHATQTTHFKVIFHYEIENTPCNIIRFLFVIVCLHTQPTNLTRLTYMIINLSGRSSIP